MVLALALLLTATPGHRLRFDVPLTVGLAVGALSLDTSAPQLTRPSCPCARSDVPSFDRLAVDAHFAHGGQLANAALAIGLAGSALVLALEAPEPVGDLAIVAEAGATAAFTTELAKIAFARPYPYMFRSGATGGGINFASMWSGHTAVLMAVGIASARLLDLRDAPMALRVAMWIAAPVLALAAGALEISQGNHFPSDVVVGAAAGGAIGFGAATFR